ncbi:hypothetical protein ACT29H_04385 [Thermophagus sp. OGC60D27]|uniref:hypothetical protein n=1 Tax=Thermophagus sp. OGC60D27 TaxID=3458415 RepID=UPI00403795D6
MEKHLSIGRKGTIPSGGKTLFRWMETAHSNNRNSGVPLNGTELFRPLSTSYFVDGWPL